MAEIRQHDDGELGMASMWTEKGMEDVESVQPARVALSIARLDREIKAYARARR